MSRRRIRPEWLDGAMASYADGHRLEALSTELGIPAETIRYHLTVEGVQLRDDRGSRVKAVGDRLDLAGKTSADVRRWAREHGIHVPARGTLPVELVERFFADQPTH